MALKNEELNRLHDGELADEGAARARLDEGDQAKLAALDEVGAVVRNTLLGQADSDGVDVWAAVAARLPATAPAPTRVRAEGEPATAWQRLRRWLTDYRLLVPALAAAAALLVWLGTANTTISNACDIEELEISGAAATVLHLDSDDKAGGGTVIWMNEDER